MKRLISLFMSFVMLFSVSAGINFSAYAEDDYIRGDFQSGKKAFTGDEGFCYSDKYFTENDATVYNPSLATMSCCLAFASYHASGVTFQNCEKVQKACGFGEIGIKEYNYTVPSKPDGIACLIGAKRIGAETLICVTVRGSGYDTEWASNVNLGSSGVHTGFDLSGKKIVDYIRSYISEKNITGGIKLWLQGYSRAGACASHAAAELNKTTISGVTFDKTNVYAYCYAVPCGADANDDTIHSEAYNNIFNIVEFNDPISCFAPLKWGFDRYGTTLVLPSRESISSDTYAEYVALLKDKLGVNYGLDSHKGFRFSTTDTQRSPYIETKLINDKAIKETVGSFNRKGLNLIADSVGSRKNYITYYEEDLMKLLVTIFDDNLSTDWNLAFQLINRLLSQMGYDSPSVSMSVLINLISVIHVHANQRYYIYWLQSMDPNYAGSLPVQFSYANYRALIVNGNADITVYDSKNRLAAEIQKEMPKEIEGSYLVSTLDENHNKLVYLPVDDSFKVEIKANDDTNVTAKIEEYDIFFGVSLRETVVSNIKLCKGESILSDVGRYSEEVLQKKFAEPSTVQYRFMKDDHIIAPSLDVGGRENVKAKTYHVNVKYDDAKGMAYGGGFVTEGTGVLLQQEPKEGYKFDGFYADGIKITDEDLDNNRYSVFYIPRSDIVVEARYALCEHKNIVKKITSATTSANGTHIEYCNDCKKILVKKDIPKLRVSDTVKLNSTKIVKLNAKVKRFAVKWKKVKNITGYQIQYSRNKNFKKSKTITVKGANKTSKTIKRLKSKKKYYVKVRTYKKSAGKTYYSSWSKAKTVKVK